MSFVFAANWKMNKNPQDSKEFFASFLKNNNNLEATDKVLFFVPSVNASATSEALASQQQMAWGPQNIFPASNGAYTGETSATVMADMGAQFALVGHSERRAIFGETDEFCQQKLSFLNENNLGSVLCIGESLDQRKAGETLTVLKQQLDRGLKDINFDQPLHIAYEPVWAIGTGEVANVEQVSEAHGFIRSWLQERFPSSHQKMAILYGGSVKPENASELADASEVSGFLVGGASLKPDSFTAIIQAVRG